jgi:outer membrane protein assembly factor BamB/outer membrane protein OmpA-like peptidoglycan-associated protein
MRIFDTLKALRASMQKTRCCYRAFQIFFLSTLILFFFFVPPSVLLAQWDYDVTLTGYPNAKWKALTSYIDKPALGDVTGDGVPEIIATGIFGDVYCIDGATGRILWTYEDEHSFDLAIYICPAVVDVNCDNVVDVISVTPQGYVICLDGRNGRKIWDFKAEAPIVFSPTAFDLDRNGTPEMAASDLAGNLYILSSTGDLLNKIKNNAPFYGAPAMGLIGKEPIIVASDRTGSMHCFSANDGKPLWKFAPSSTPFSTSPILFEDPGNASAPWKVLVGSDDGTVYLVNARNGSMIWSRVLAKKQALGDFSLGSLGGDSGLDFVFTTSGSYVIAASVSDGKQLWSRKLNVPVKEYLSLGQQKKVVRTAVAGEPVLADCDGDGKLDVVIEIRGLNNYVYSLRGSDGAEIWKYGNKNLLVNPALNESVVLSTYQETTPLNAFSETVPVYSQPTPIVGDFSRSGKAELIINDRDEVGLISVPLANPLASGSWAKYVANACNNTMKFSAACLGEAPRPSLSLEIDPHEITQGESARLCWKTTSEGTLEIDQGIGIVKAQDCTKVTPAGDTMWHATVKSCGGEARNQISLLVKAKRIPAPTIEEWALEDIFFEYDWYRLTPDAIKTLDENIAKLKQHPQARVALETTCDERGTGTYNQLLSVARAQSARDYMLAKGIESVRMIIRPQGETTRWDSKLDDAGWALNRRVHFVILP